MRGQVSMLITKDMTRLHVGLRVLYSGPALGQPPSHVKTLGHKSADPPRGAQVGLGVAVGAGAQRRSNLHGRSCPMRKLIGQPIQR